MDDLTRTLAPLVEHPPAPPTDLEVITRRATARRRVRWAASGGVTLALIGGVVLASSVLRPVATPTVDPVGQPPAADAPDDGPLPPPQEPEPDVPAAGVTAPPDAAPTDQRTDEAEPQPTDGADVPEFSSGEADPYPDARVVEWVDDQGRIAWQSENGRDGGWIAGYFRTRDAVENGTDEPPVMFWTRVSDEGEDHPREDLLKMALDTLTARPPDGHESAVAGVDLRLTSAVQDGTWLTLDHPTGTILTDNGYGSAGAAEFAYQYLAVVRHYYPDVDTVCISIDGVESREDGPVILHDAYGCPWSLR